ncbi:MAG: helix-turn-helix transcriptional regulator [Chloroflexota bacterium]
MMVYKEFGDLVHEYIVKLDRSEVWIAKQLNLSKTTVNRWRNGESRPKTPELTAKFADLLGIYGEKRQKFLSAAGYAVVSNINNLPSESILLEEELMSSSQKIADEMNDQDSKYLDSEDQSKHQINAGVYVAGALYVEGGIIVAETIENSTISTGNQARKSDLDVLMDALDLGARNEQIRLGQAFQSLWSLIETQFEHHQNLELITTHYMEAPDVWALPLRKALAQAKLDKESSITDASYTVLNK